MKKLIIFTILGLSTLAAKAQIPQPDPDTTAKHFLIVASIGNLQEISASEQAVQKANQADVRSFGQMMIKDHGDAQHKLLAVASTSGYNLPTAATGGIQPDLNLKKAKGNFDQLYVHAMLVNHKNTVLTFENYATTGKDPNVKAFAQQTLPTLKEHLAEVQKLDEELKNHQQNDPVVRAHVMQ